MSNTALLAQVISTVSGNGSSGSSGDGGPATSAASSASSVALDAAGNLYVSDGINNRIRKVTIATGIISTVAGTGAVGFSGDGGPAVSAQLSSPGDICVDAMGNIYFNDNQNFRVRKVDAATGIITTVAGNGGGNFFGGTAVAVNAGIHYPNGLAIDASYLYISLFSQQIVCKLELATGILSTIAGNGSNSYSGDGGPALAAGLGYPSGLSVTASGEIYIADYNNNRIRKIDASGIITTVAGNGIAAFSGDGGPATSASINLPTGVFVDGAGNIFIADNSNYRIRKVAAGTGIIKTVAGSGNYGFGGDGGSATDPCTKMADPHKVRVDAVGNLFIGDASNLRIRKVNTLPVVTLSPAINIAAAANPICNGASVTFSATVTNAGASPVYQWKINGINTGSNNASFTSLAIINGDNITCELTASTACNNATVLSNTITVAVTASVTPSLVISSNAANICQGNAASFTATPSNAGTSPSFQWKINGVNTGTNNPSFTSSSLSDNDIISCTLTSNSACAIPANSNTITIRVNPVVAPAINIVASATSICTGSPVTFTATATDCGSNPFYQWKINNVNTGTNNPVFITSALQNNNVVSCSVVADASLACLTTPGASSNQIQVAVSASLAPLISIAASDNYICAGTLVNFTAAAQNAGISPTYQWLLNDTNTGVNNAVYPNNNLVNGDQVRCVITANNTGCPALPVSSVAVTMVVYEKPGITITPTNTMISPGTQVLLSTSVNMTAGSFVWTPQGLLQNPYSLNAFTVPLDTTTTFTLAVTSIKGCSDTAMVTINVNKLLLMPSAFTPDGNNYNDIFRIPRGVSLKLFEFAVYNRWGHKVFSTSDIAKGWDGRYAGVLCNTGSYIYTIDGILQERKVLLKGNVILIR